MLKAQILFNRTLIDVKKYSKKQESLYKKRSIQVNKGLTNTYNWK